MCLLCEGDRNEKYGIALGLPRIPPRSLHYHIVVPKLSLLPLRLRRCCEADFLSLTHTHPYCFAMARTDQRGPSKTSRKTRASGSQTPAVFDVYHEMLAEAASSAPTRFGEEGQSVKRRRIRGRIVTQGENISSDIRSSPAPDTAGQAEGDYKPGGVSHVRLQTTYNDSEDSADNDVAWEDVGVKDEEKEASSEEPEELDLVLGGDKSDSFEGRRTRKRKPVTAVERGMRIEIHKMHLLSLLVHVSLRNHWCNDYGVQVCEITRLFLG